MRRKAARVLTSAGRAGRPDDPAPPARRPASARLQRGLPAPAWVDRLPLSIPTCSVCMPQRPGHYAAGRQDTCLYKKLRKPPRKACSALDAVTEPMMPGGRRKDMLDSPASQKCKIAPTHPEVRSKESRPPCRSLGLAARRSPRRVHQRQCRLPHSTYICIARAFGTVSAGTRSCDGTWPYPPTTFPGSFVAADQSRRQATASQVSYQQQAGCPAASINVSDPAGDTSWHLHAARLCEGLLLGTHQWNYWSCRGVPATAAVVD